MNGAPVMRDEPLKLEKQPWTRQRVITAYTAEFMTNVAVVTCGLSASVNAPTILWTFNTAINITSLGQIGMQRVAYCYCSVICLSVSE